MSQEEVTIPRYAPIENMALKFEGSKKAFVSVPSINLPSESDFTIEAWFRIYYEGISSVNGPQIKCSSSSDYFEITLEVVKGKLNLFVSSSVGKKTEVTKTTDLPTQWFHLSTTWKWNKDTTDFTVTVYIDGELWGELEEQMKLPKVETYSLKMGYLTDAKTDSSIMDLRLWKGVLDQSMIQKLRYELLFGKLEITSSGILQPVGNAESENTTLTGNWHLNEGYGDIAFNYAGDQNAQLGGEEETNQEPGWVVSTFKPEILFSYVKDDDPDNLISFATMSRFVEASAEDKKKVAA